MAMSHADCTHERTPAARAKCRKDRTRHGIAQGVARLNTTPLKVVPRTRGDGGVVKATRRAGRHDLKRPGTRVRERHDLADVPRVFMRAINYAWLNDWPVIVGGTYTDDHRHLVVRSELGDVHVAWSSANPNGLQRVSWRPADSSVTRHVSTLNGALRLAAGEEE